VVRQTILILEVLGSNHQGLYFFTIKTTNTMVQADTCAEFKIEFEFEQYLE
jgi:hypothetical protein